MVTMGRSVPADSAAIQGCFSVLTCPLSLYAHLLGERNTSWFLLCLNPLLWPDLETHPFLLQPVSVPVQTQVFFAWTWHLTCTILPCAITLYVLMVVLWNTFIKNRVKWFFPWLKKISLCEKQHGYNNNFYQLNTTVKNGFC